MQNATLTGRAGIRRRGKSVNAKDCGKRSARKAIVTGQQLGYWLSKYFYLSSYYFENYQVVKQFRADRNELLRRSHIGPKTDSPRKTSDQGYCSVCAMDGYEHLSRLTCGHCFCEHCWKSHIESRLSEGVAARIECMESECEIYAPSEFVISLLEKSPALKMKYERFLLRDMVNAHPHLKFCVGNDCQVVIRSTEVKPKRVTCQLCHTSSW